MTQTIHSIQSPRSTHSIQSTQTDPAGRTTFDHLPLSPATRTALAGMRITVPTPIQAHTLPLLLDGRDVIGQARTGSGKTLAFGVPLVERCRAGRGAAQALVLTPTRELASQVGGVLAHLGQGHRLRVVELVGGRSYGPQAAALRAGAEVVVGTPGRILDHLKQTTLGLVGLTYFVLDEADEMLDRGFGPDVERIIGHMPGGAGGAMRRQNALFSATIPDWVRQVAARLLHHPAEVQVDAGKPAAASADTIEHLVYDVPAGAKFAVLRALLDAPAEGEASTGQDATLVFGRTRHGVRKLARDLAREGYHAEALQSNLGQNARDRVIDQFRRGEVPILVATNVAARGLDVAHLGRVINYDLPENGLLFTHRVGRTGRMGRAGQAITLLAPEDQPKWRQLEKELKAAGLTRPLPRRSWSGSLPATSIPAAPAAPQLAETSAAAPPFSGRRQQATERSRPIRIAGGDAVRQARGYAGQDVRLARPEGGYRGLRLPGERFADGEAPVAAPRGAARRWRRWSARAADQPGREGGGRA